MYFFLDNVKIRGYKWKHQEGGTAAHKTGKGFKMEKLISGNRVFEIVKEIPEKYVVWNIGRHNFDFEGYIPLCLSDKNFNVDVSTLKAFKMESEEKALYVLKKAGRRTIKAKEIKLINAA